MRPVFEGPEKDLRGSVQQEKQEENVILKLGFSIEEARKPTLFRRRR